MDGDTNEEGRAMSETSEQHVTTREARRCEKAAHEVMRSSLNQPLNESVLQMTIASTIDRLAADVAEIKEAVCGNHSKTSNSSPAAPQPAAPQPGWLTEVAYRAAMDAVGVKWKEVGRE